MKEAAYPRCMQQGKRLAINKAKSFADYNPKAAFTLST